jgi:riboflavin kinase/FMN adenylyltransferase
MHIINNIKNLAAPFKNPVITIGNFDGVHLGHQALFHEVIKKANAMSGTSIAVSFEPHPIKVLNPKHYLPLITLYEQKAELIERCGIDVFICIPFTREFASVSARFFVEDLLVKQIGIKAIVVGNDYRFGKNREGNTDLLKTYGERLGFEVIVSSWQQIPNSLEKISSTSIRKLVVAGKVEDTQKLLGRYYQIRGNVVSGRNRGGRLLGFPTANINLTDELCPKAGVYAVTVACLNKTFKGVANIGYSPTFDDHIFTVEVHILNFNENINNQTVRVNFIQRIRDEKKFSNIKELSHQIEKDIKTAEDILNSSVIAKFLSD